MPGTITFRPIEANLTHNTELIGKMNPYCAFIVGESVFRGSVCKKGGKHPHWDDSVTIPYTNQSQIIVEVMDKDRFSRDDNIGSFLVNLNELSSTGQGSRWYPLTYKNKPAGELLLETSFSGLNQGGFSQTGYNTQTGYNNQSGFTQSSYQETEFNKGAGVGYVESERISQPMGDEFVNRRVEQEIIREEIPVHERKIFQEQQQVVEPRTFLKEVDVVETKPHLENIEVLEPQKVLKEVQYTKAVPVTKQIEVTEPQVVKKEVEVIEPRLVTKTIQVIENVPVKKQVEVIESVTKLQEVETFEPQTFTKQVEVTDYVPVQKQVTVTEPVHLKKAVEFVEPVITTKTITKELLEPVIVDESITTTVGPASILRETELYFARYDYWTELSQQERLYRTNEYQRFRGLGYSDNDIEREFETRGWGRKNPFTGLTKEEKLLKEQEFDRLRAQGYTKREANSVLKEEGLGKQHTMFGKKI